MTDQQNPASDKTPIEAAVEHAVETLVYAPIGLLFEGASLLPELVEKGKNQVTMARMIGKFAVEQGRDEAIKAATKLQDQAAGVLDFIGGTVMPPVAASKNGAEESPRRGSASQASRRVVVPPRAPGAARDAARKVAGVTDPVAPPPRANPTALGISDYDGLSASHVVNRLAGLSSDELEAVRVYEAANRGRKTILSKVAQLQSS